MERPSHINFNTSHPFSRRLTMLGLAISFPLAVLWGLTQGLGGTVLDVFHGPLQVQLDKQVEPKTPPPDPRMIDAVPIKPTQPIFTTEPEQKNDTVRTSDKPVQPQQTQTMTAGPDRAPAAIAATHTTPPYPLLARRMGAEGKVILRLTVLTDGTVGRADIVASSGRYDLDEAAQQWIVAHWTYRPALDKGEPAVSQTLASVIFSLQNQR